MTIVLSFLICIIPLIANNHGLFLLLVQNLDITNILLHTNLTINSSKIILWSLFWQMKSIFPCNRNLLNCITQAQPCPALPSPHPNPGLLEFALTSFSMVALKKIEIGKSNLKCCLEWTKCLPRMEGRRPNKPPLSQRSYNEVPIATVD